MIRTDFKSIYYQSESTRTMSDRDTKQFYFWHNQQTHYAISLRLFILLVVLFMYNYWQTSAIDITTMFIFTSSSHIFGFPQLLISQQILIEKSLLFDLHTSFDKRVISITPHFTKSIYKTGWANFLIWFSLTWATIPICYYFEKFSSLMVALCISRPDDHVSCIQIHYILRTCRKCGSKTSCCYN